LGNEAQQPPSFGSRQLLPAEVLGNALLAAGDLQEFGIQGRPPAPIDTAGKEGLIERLAVQFLSIGKRAVDVEYQGVECGPESRHKCAPTNARAWDSFLHSSRRQIIGVKINCIARSIFPPGHTMVFGRDMNESWSIDSR